MEMNGGFLVTKIKQLGDRIFEKILSEKNIDAFNGAQGRILYVLMAADVYNELGQTDKAITLANEVLKRARQSGNASQPADWKRDRKSTRLNSSH